MNTNAKGREYWASVEHLADTPAVRDAIDREFGGYDPDQIASMPRRSFLKLSAAAMALAGIGLSGCRRWPKEKILPYSAAPENHVPGQEEYYASQFELSGVATGLLVKSFDFRPIKIEGNPNHPYSRQADTRYGATTSQMQASLLEFYDPDRSRGIRDRRGVDASTATPEQFNAFLAERRAALKGNGGRLAILSEATSSPTVTRLRLDLLAAFPGSKWYTWDPLHRDNEIAGLGGARPVLMLDKADVVVSFDDDLLGKHPAALRHAADWVTRRRSVDDNGSMSRVYCVESTFSITGASADVRVPAKPSEIEAMVFALRAKLAGSEGGAVSGEMSAAIDRIAAELQSHRGAAVVAVGAHLSPAAHAAAFAINTALGAVGKTVRYATLPTEMAGSRVDDIKNLAGAMDAGQVDTLLILGGNPVYDAPVDLEFAKKLAKVPNSIHLSLYDDETSVLCKWHYPKAHYLESWGDGRAWDGTVSHQQPLIQPMYGGKSCAEMLAMFQGRERTEGDVIARETLTSLRAGASENDYRKFVHDGVLADSGFETAAAPAAAVAPSNLDRVDGDFELRFTADFHTYDGRFANNGWMVEQPDPMTRLTWDNAALISIADAEKLGVKNGSILRITTAGRSLDIAAFVMPGQPAGVIELPLGWARTRAGNVGDGTGFDTYSLRTSGATYVAGAKVEKVHGHYELVATVEHQLMDDVGATAREERVGTKNHSGRIVKESTLGDFKKNRNFVNEGKHGNLRLQIYDAPLSSQWKAKAKELREHGHPSPRLAFNDPHAWGMSIDMTACIGCGACVTACQAENNIPIVGKTHVMKNREMHWLRIDRYFKGDATLKTIDERMRDPNPQVVFQPMMCVHCENAPCEQVCPVAATVHDTEGLNTMVYNRCIGTRYCSNNCPYKVRRFNYLDYHSQNPRNVHPRPYLWLPDTQQENQVDRVKQMLFNPQVTVRMRGVMEKCTYCVQRIKQHTIPARNAGRDLVDGEIATACQQTCPTQAIVFGDLNLPDSAVSVRHRSDRAYEVLEDLNTRPRTRHLARIRNGTEETQPSPHSA